MITDRETNRLHIEEKPGTYLLEIMKSPATDL